MALGSCGSSFRTRLIYNRSLELGRSLQIGQSSFLFLHSRFSFGKLGTVITIVDDGEQVSSTHALVIRYGDVDDEPGNL